LLQEKGFDFMRPRRIALIGDFNPGVIAHRAIPQAIELAADQTDYPVEAIWVGTATLGPDVPSQLADFDAIWCVPASPYANTEGALAAIRFARESGRPFLGTCGGFQHALLEYARNVLGMPDAEHAELAPHAPSPLIAPLSCSLVEKSGIIRFAQGSRLRSIYGVAEAEETYHCNYGLNPRHGNLFEVGAMRIGGRDRDGEVRAVELVSQPFFFATLYQPERAALHGRAHPLVSAFVAATGSSRSSPASSAPLQ
jgi:CTP synthase (UTP-ammonia lyase)